MSIVIYHSGFDTVGGPEGPYDPEVDPEEQQGIDRLITSVRDAGVAPGGNVYAELGSTWRAVMGSPDGAAHVIGKLLVAFGDTNVVWGTDSIWYGSPQDQIEAFRTFEITPEFQERFGYPELTAERKERILGRNSAELYGVEPVTCGRSAAERSGIRMQAGTRNVLPGPTTADDARAVMAWGEPWERA